MNDLNLNSYFFGFLFFNLRFQNKFNQLNTRLRVAYSKQNYSQKNVKKVGSVIVRLL